MAEYFSHDSNARNDEKIIMLRMKHGWEGYGIYWAIIERLRDSGDYSSVTDYNLIAFDLRTDAAKIKSIINDFGLFSFTENGKRFYSDSLKKRMDIKDEKSDKARRAASIRWSNNTDKPPLKPSKDADAMQTHSERNADAMQVKESKVNKPPISPTGDDGEFSFNRFWDLYDKKVDRDKCERKWSRLNANDKRTIISYLPEYVKATPDKQFRKNPTTFLNNRSWENELPQSPMSKKPVGQDDYLARLPEDRRQAYLMAKLHGA